jgi:hypothetical protein
MATKKPRNIGHISIRFKVSDVDDKLTNENDCNGCEEKFLG